LTSSCDDGIVVGLDMARSKTKIRTKMASVSEDHSLRWNLIKEDLLRRRITVDEEFRKAYPESWKRIEASRLARNRETTALNRRLRGAGLRPVPLDLSFEQRVKELQKLESVNRAEASRRRRA
jgi:hypothetical protein